MLQRMRILEEKGQSFAPTALKDLPIIGAEGRGGAAPASRPLLGTCPLLLAARL
jgi:hypothetical protein